VSGPPVPGRQRRWKKGNDWFSLVFVTLFAIGCLGGAGFLLVAGLPEDAEHRDSRLTGAAVMFGVALLMAGLAFAIYRKMRPRKAAHLALDVPRSTVRRGEMIDGTLRLLDATQVRGDVKVSLRCVVLHTVRGGPKQGDITKEEAVHEVTVDAPGDGQAHPFRFRVPAEGPFSYEGQILSMVWSVIARDAVGLRGDRVQQRELRVLP